MTDVHHCAIFSFSASHEGRVTDVSHGYPTYIIFLLNRGRVMGWSIFNNKLSGGELKNLINSTAMLNGVKCSHHTLYEASKSGWGKDTH
jgi:hypothetical protein